MAYFTEEDDYFQEEAEVPFKHQMEERSVQALGHHVQDSVSQALIKALKPFTQPLVRFGQRELMGRPYSESLTRDPQTDDRGLAPRAPLGSFSSGELFSQIATAVLKDHEYGYGLRWMLNPSQFRQYLAQRSPIHLLHTHLIQITL
ncbi:hypothetical protein NDU88_008065 [Pleurodeles waltl]|uniref:Uncharacterized protein n=1 Tax=Pleurodeles waltl TaxID=8319 RepID=A0AAV7N838_PLEWA|nr:hypothetical protein NDU88_008065 [Pleurodeles waltl]